MLEFALFHSLNPQALLSEINSHLGEPATNPGLGLVSIAVQPSGHTIPVYASKIVHGVGFVTIGDVLNALRGFNHVRNVEVIPGQGTKEEAKGFWTWVVEGKPMTGYLVVDIQDVVRLGG
jgi:hypothetical protein